MWRVIVAVDSSPAAVAAQLGRGILLDQHARAALRLAVAEVVSDLVEVPGLRPRAEITGYAISTAWPDGQPEMTVTLHWRPKKLLTFNLSAKGENRCVI